MMGQLGCDFVLLDDEHGQGDFADHLACLRALSSTPATGLIRLASADPIRIGRFLDFGVEGIMVAGIATVGQAEAVVAACRYPPRGTRGYGASGVRASDYGLRKDAYLAGAEHEILIAVMIESAEGVRNARAIAAVDGVDVLQIGANDLSYDLGVPDQLSHPELLEAIAQIENAARQSGKMLGGAPIPPGGLSALLDNDYRLITLSRDGTLFAGAVTERLMTARKSANTKQGEKA